MDSKDSNPSDTTQPRSPKGQKVAVGKYITAPTTPITTVGALPTSIFRPMAAPQPRTYGPLTPRIQALEMSDWYDVRQLMDFVKNCRRRNIYIASDRDAMIADFNRLYCQCPFGESSRFIENKFYVCDGCGDWSRKFMKLRLALHFKSGDKDSKSKAKPDEEASGIVPSDVVYSFAQTLEAIAFQIQILDAVWSRETFEAYYGLKWQ